MKLPFNLQRFFVGDGPQAVPFQLHHRRVYILPTKYGLIFAALLFIMLLASVNYNNNMGHLLTFLLGSMAIISIFHTYRNLLSLQVGPVASKPVFAKQRLEFGLQITNHHFHARAAVECYLPGHKSGHSSANSSAGAHQIMDIPANSTATMKLALRFDRRGYQAIPRFVIETIYPFGLFRAWCHVELQQALLVYPVPASENTLPAHSQGEEEGEVNEARGQDDFAGLKTWQPGDSLYHVHWKSAAKHHILQTKQYTGSVAEERYLRWQDSTQQETEARLSQLTAWVLLADQAGTPYGLDIPGQHILANTGEAHKHRCLTALALYGSDHATPF